jgi:hypothetical protein
MNASLLLIPTSVVYRMKMVIRVCAIASRKRLMEDLQQYGSMIQQYYEEGNDVLYDSYCCEGSYTPTFDDVSPTGGGN